MKVDEKDIIRMYYIRSEYNGLEPVNYCHCESLEELNTIINDAINQHNKMMSHKEKELPFIDKLKVGLEVKLNNGDERNFISEGFFVKLEFDNQEPIYAKI